MPAIGASDAGEAMGQNPAALETLQGAGDDSPEGTVSRGVAIVVRLEEGLRVVRNQLPERRGFGFAGAIGRRALGGSRGFRRLARYDSKGARHHRTAPLDAREPAQFRAYLTGLCERRGEARRGG